VISVSFHQLAQPGLEGYAMSETTTFGSGIPEVGYVDLEVAHFRENFEGRDILDQLVRRGAQQLLQQAMAAEVQEFLQQHDQRRDANGKRLVVGNGHKPARKIVTGAGALEVQQPRVRDHAPSKDQRVQFSSAILPPYLRRSKAIEEFIPWLYLKGIATGDFSEALRTFLGEQAKGLSPHVIVRLKEQWTAEYDAWNRRDLTGKHYVYLWADGIYVNVRLQDTDNKRPCILVVMAATAEGHKELLAVMDGYRESEQSWHELLVDLRQRGLTLAPQVATGDGALGFWAALRKLYPQTREQRCWVHKTANVLNKMPKSVHARAKADLHEIWLAETRTLANKAFDAFLAKYQAKYEGACACLRKDREVLLTYYDFPAEHWKHLRTTNPIESTFATIRLRHQRTKGNGTRRTSLAMMFKLAQAAQKKGRRLDGHAQVDFLLQGRVFVDGMLQDAA
jgi:putative transposase